MFGSARRHKGFFQRLLVRFKQVIPHGGGATFVHHFKQPQAVRAAVDLDAQAVAVSAVGLRQRGVDDVDVFGHAADHMKEN